MNASSGERRLRVGVVGLGNVAIPHLEAYRSLSEIEVVAGAELREDRLRDLAAKYDFTPYRDYRDMLRGERLDIACVLTPVNMHREFVETIADEHVHVLCEKPIALRATDAEAMIAHCASRGVKLCYGASYRFLPALMKARELIAEGAIGEVHLLLELVLGGRGSEHQHHMGFSHYPQGEPGGSGMGMVDHGIHLVDSFAWLLDDRIVSVYGRGNRSGESAGVELMTMNFAHGAVGQLIYSDATFSSDLPTEGIFSAGAGWNVAGTLLPARTWHDQPGNIRVHGTKGALRIYHYANQLFLTADDGQVQVPVLDMPTPGNFALQMQSFARSVSRDEPPAVTGADGLRALQAVLAAYQSFDQKRLITVTPS